MRLSLKITVVTLVVALLGTIIYSEVASKMSLFKKEKVVITLPSPQLKGEISLEEAIKGRRSRRNFAKGGLSLNEVSQLLWAASGTTDKERGFRAAPSAGALYPLDIFLVCGEVEGLKKGVYHYLPADHSLELTKDEDLRERLCQAALSQGSISEAPMILVITAEYERVSVKYGKRGIRYAQIEVGHVGQNLFLQAETLGLSTVTIGAFYDEEVKKLLSLPAFFQPLYIMPFGRRLMPTAP